MSDGALQVEIVQAPGAEWDAFASATPGVTLGHAAAWAGILTEAYGLETRYLAVRDRAGALRGVLPLARFQTLRRRSEWISLPFLDLAGILARDVSAEQALLEAARDLVRDTGADALELRQLTPLRSHPESSGVERVGMVLPLRPDAESQWTALPAKVRNQTRKAERSGLVLGGDGDGDGLADFFEPFATNMRDLGSPVHGRRFFEVMRDAFGERLRFVVTRDGARTVGGLVAIDYAATVSVPWASTLRRDRARCPNNQIYWEALRWATERGARIFDFGRSPRDEGTWRFKKGWGASERELAWTRLDSSGATLAITSPGDSGLLSSLSSLWQRLPVGLTTRFGPSLRRRIAS